MAEHGRNESQRAVLRQQIVETALNAFISKGIKNITMDEIATILGISKRTLYELFEDKEALLVACILKSQKDWQEKCKTIYEQSNNVLEVILFVFQHSIEKYKNTSHLFFEDMRKYPNVLAKLEERDKSTLEGTLLLFNQGVTQGIFRSDINFSISSMLIHEQFKILLNLEITKQYSFIEVFESIMFTYIRGISTVKGAELLDEFISKYRRYG